MEKILKIKFTNFNNNSFLLKEINVYIDARRVRCAVNEQHVLLFWHT